MARIRFGRYYPAGTVRFGSASNEAVAPPATVLKAKITGLKLRDLTTGAPDLTGLVAHWWNNAAGTGAPALYFTGVALTSGAITITLTGTTLSAGQVGHIYIPSGGTDPTLQFRGFAGPVTVVEEAP